MIGPLRHNLSDSLFLFYIFYYYLAFIYNDHIFRNSSSNLEFNKICTSLLPITPLNYILRGVVYERMFGNLVPSPNKISSMLETWLQNSVCPRDAGRGEIPLKEDGHHEESQTLRAVLKYFLSLIFRQEVPRTLADIFFIDKKVPVSRWGFFSN